MAGFGTERAIALHNIRAAIYLSAFSDQLSLMNSPSI